MLIHLNNINYLTIKSTRYFFYYYFCKRCFFLFANDKCELGLEKRLAVGIVLNLFSVFTNPLLNGGNSSCTSFLAVAVEDEEPVALDELGGTALSGFIFVDNVDKAGKSSTFEDADSFSFLGVVS